MVGLSASSFFPLLFFLKRDLNLDFRRSIASGAVPVEEKEKSRQPKRIYTMPDLILPRQMLRFVRSCVTKSQGKGDELGAVFDFILFCSVQNPRVGKCSVDR